MKSPFLLLAAAVFVLAACDSGGSSDVDAEDSTWSLIQSRILVPKCTQACHSAGTSVVAQSGLVLTSDVSYDQLVGVAPTNTSANKAGLLRVHTTSSTDLHQSFLWEKINAPEQDHLLEEHPEYGSIMPLGAGPLSYGELSFIRRWILAGAPEDGVVADPIILTDTATFRATVFEPLPLLAPNEGLSVRLGPFDVPAQFEREFFYRMPEDFPETRLVKRTTISLASGSHHFIIHSYPQSTPPSRLPYPGLIRDLRKPNGNLDISVLRQMQDQVFLSGTQWPRMDYQFPDGVALELAAGTIFDLNPHYVNRTDEVQTGEVHLNFEYADPAEVDHVARVLQLNNIDFVLPPRAITTVTKTFLADEALQVFQLFSHAHEHMLDFRVEMVGTARAGETVYLATDYEHPPILEVDPPLEVAAGEGFRLVVTYDNWTDYPLSFGFRSEDEMMILFGYYFTESGKLSGDGSPFRAVD
ncbi:MAG: hypothetical protein ACI9W4_001718 [Rhodothermales bacterium]|jgi:hypothetical protein